MSLESALATYWLADPQLTALVGQHIYPITAKQSAPLPYMTWQRLSEVPTYHMGGRSNLTSATVQVECWADTSPQVAALAQAFLALCDRTFQDTQENIDIRHLTIVNDIDVPQTPDDGGQQGVFCRAIDLQIWYRQIL